jgi:hypothetical protein
MRRRVKSAPVGSELKLLLAAHQFYLAAELCDRRSTPDGSAWLIYPEVVNRAFACELALKGLIAGHSKVLAYGHDLKELFGMLPSTIQDHLRWPDIPVALFEERLHQVKDTFELWRYAHEWNSLTVSVQFLRKLAIAAIDALHGQAAPSAIMLKSIEPQEFF